ncbi:MAG TPA: GGDEF domain-containing protein [Polyangia bacterium]|jgi:diguanylate cyclase (GGDEF)-like protein|nr:GGDEF domain-containing protein [Polyangia bacterium]
MDNGSGPGSLKDQTHTKPATPIESDKEQKRNIAYLVVLAGVSAGEMFKLQLDKTIIGRGPRCAVRLNDEGVSREHCQLVREGEKVVLEDLGSTNGTFCNGIRVDRRELADGDKIMVGSTTILKFTYHDYLDEVFQRQMYESALRDGLTKVFNKKYFTDYLEKEFAYAARHSSPLALIFLDIDYFKRINDTHGHPAGDFVLSELSQLMATLVRTEDVLARFGGEEFTVLCRGTDVGGAKIVAERLRRTVEAHTFSFGAKTIPVTISLGIAGIDPSIVDHAQFLAAADKALYEAKRTGRNRVCIHGTEKTPVPQKRPTGSGPVNSG